MRIAEIGEFALIERLAQIAAVERDDLRAGIGDDVAVLDTGGNELLLATVDAQVEEIHFLARLSTPEQLGRRALAINVSDIAAMGGQPRFALVSLVLPGAIEVAWVEALYQGLRAVADETGTAIVGGNLARSPAGIVIDVTVLGSVQREHLLLRSGARPGDRVLVTGRLGDAAAGLHLALHEEPELDPGARATLLARYLTPTPRLAEAQVIARSRLATAMIDLSDGLSSDIGHICARSGVGARIDVARLPIASATATVAAFKGMPAWQLALSGGEDYELCFTAPAAAAGKLAALVERETGTPVADIGEILPQNQGRMLVFADGATAPLDPQGWNHFRPDDAAADHVEPKY